MNSEWHLSGVAYPANPLSPVIPGLILQGPGYCQSRSTAIFIAVDILQASYGFQFPLLSDRIPRLVQRLVLKHSVDDANYKRVVNVLLDDVLLYDEPLAVQLDRFINCNYRLIRHECVYVLQRIYLGYQWLRYTEVLNSNFLSNTVN